MGDIYMVCWRRDRKREAVETVPLQSVELLFKVTRKNTDLLNLI